MPTELADCVFCAIVAGVAPATVIRRWEDVIAIRPRGGVNEGHVLVIPHTHVADAGVDRKVSGRTMECASELMAEHPNANIITSRGAAATQTVYHLHIHLVPRVAGDGLTLPWTDQAEREQLRAERDAAMGVLDVLRSRIEDAGSLMATAYVREALDGGTARILAEYLDEQQQAKGAGQ